MIIPDQAMTMHDHTGLHAHGRQNGAAEGRPFPAGYARCFICIEIIGWRGIGQADQPDIAEAIHRHQRFAPGARMPAGDAHQVPHQPGPEERPDMVEVALKVRMHAHKDGAAPCQTNSDDPRGVILENAKRFSGTQFCSRHTASGARIFAPQIPGWHAAAVGQSPISPHASSPTAQPSGDPSPNEATKSVMRGGNIPRPGHDAPRRIVQSWPSRPLRGRG